MEENTEEVFLIESHEVKGANIHEGEESVQVKGKSLCYCPVAGDRRALRNREGHSGIGADECWDVIVP